MFHLIPLMVLVFVIAACGSEHPATSDGASESMDATSDGSAGSICRTNADCDDRIACTDDICTSMATIIRCIHTVQPARCAGGQTCDPRRGCVPGQACTRDMDCQDSNQCTVRERCDSAARVCLYDYLDGDEDGEPPRVCGGNDCNDSDRSIGPFAGELCDGIDNNCNGQADESPRDCGRGMTCQGAGQPGATCRCTQPEVPGQFQRCRSPGGVQQICTDVRSDSAACGAECAVCPSGSTCVAGRCTCGQPGMQYCPYNSAAGGTSPGCYDTRSDWQNCGECGIRCSLNSVQAGRGCENGMCVCLPGQTPCVITVRTSPTLERSVLCTNLMTDRNNCGACSNPCLGGAECRDGTCVR